VIGRVIAAGEDARGAGGEGLLGRRVGVAWLHRTCGACRFCASGRENLCERADFTGWSAAGGFAERIVAPAAFVHPLPALEGEGTRGRGLADSIAATAPLLCAGIIGWRALRKSGLLDRPLVSTGGVDARPFRLGIYGFGAAGHLALQVARARGAEVFVATRDRARHQALARELGATWVGGADEELPEKLGRLDAAILFAPAGELVPAALRALDRGGRLVLGGIHMSETPPLPYELLWHERTVTSVAHNTRDDAREFLAEAARLSLRAKVESFPFEEADRALLALKEDAVRGAAVLVRKR
jgi:propanol-preferring alcohol dehydrogenase